MDSKKLITDYIIKSLKEIQKKGNTTLYGEAPANNFVYFSGYVMGRINEILETCKEEK